MGAGGCTGGTYPTCRCFGCSWRPATGPVGNDFPRQSLGLALHRRAVGLAQHHTMDVFESIVALLPLPDIGTLGELATELFAVSQQFTAGQAAGGRDVAADEQWDALPRTQPVSAAGTR